MRIHWSSTPFSWNQQVPVIQTSHAGVGYCTHSTMLSTLPHLLSFAKRPLRQSWIFSFYSQTDANPATWFITVCAGASITGPASLQRECTTHPSRETVESDKSYKTILSHLQYISVTVKWVSLTGLTNSYVTRPVKHIQAALCILMLKDRTDIGKTHVGMGQRNHQCMYLHAVMILFP